LTKLQKYDPKVIGLDLYRDLPQEPGHKELLARLKAPNAVAIAKLSDAESPGVPAPPGVPADRVGFNDFLLDADGVVRRNLPQSRNPIGLLLSRFLCNWPGCTSKTGCSRKIG